jgi:protein-disulfide isomerase
MMKNYGSASGIALILVGSVLVLGSLFYLMQGNKGSVAETPDGLEAPVIGTEGAEAPLTEDQSLIDVDAALAPRGMGNKDAAIHIQEFSSLSCGHCGQFHKTTLTELDSQYIQTGKVYLEFIDFPLNKPALDAVMLARCLPADQYVPFTAQLFAEQEAWAFDEAYLSKLKEYSVSYGMSDAVFDACLASEALRQGIIDRIQAVQKLYDISSTPTFVVNRADTIVGAQPLSAFEAVFNKSDDAAASDAPAEAGVEAEAEVEAVVETKDDVPAE